MRKKLIQIGFALLSVSIIITIVATISRRDEPSALTSISLLNDDDLSSLESIRQIHDFGMFKMTYFGDYGFDEFLLVGAESDGDIGEFVEERLQSNVPIEFNVTGGGCTVFVVRSPEGDVLFGRNFDFFAYSPSVQLFTTPVNGYASVSTVAIQFLGFDRNNLPDGASDESIPMLFAPFIPFDGMNENGVAIGMAAVPEAEPPFYEDRVMIGSNNTMRLVLDQAANVDEAVELLHQYNIFFSENIYLQFIIADASGRSVIINYLDGEIKVTETAESFQIASNFIPYNNLNIGFSSGGIGNEFERYDRVRQVIEANGGVLNEMQVVDLLAEVGVVTSRGRSMLQWSVVFNLTTLEGMIFADRDTENLIHFSLTP